MIFGQVIRTVFFRALSKYFFSGKDGSALSPTRKVGLCFYTDLDVTDWVHTAGDGRQTANVQKVLDNAGRMGRLWRQRRVGLQPATSGCRLVLSRHTSDHVLGACALASGHVAVIQVLECVIRSHVGYVSPDILTACSNKKRNHASSSLKVIQGHRFR